jgi:4-hydroxybenzoate polyprenyltransferase
MMTQASEPVTGGEQTVSRGTSDLFRSIVETARPRQWIKNSFVLAPLVFSGHLKEADAGIHAALAALAFTWISVATYFMNDLVDRRLDQQHPVKRFRPIASGKLSVPMATAITVVCSVLGLALGAAIHLETLAALAAYVLLHLTYTAWLKHKAIVDVLCISLGFDLRVLAGAAAIQVVPSSWLLVCTFFLATFLGFAKRAGESVRLRRARDPTGVTRPVLIVYDDRFLTSLLSITCSLTLLSYALYAIERKPPSPVLLATIPVVAYALFRYLLIALRAEKAAGAETPEALLVRDRGLIAAGIVWIGMCIVAVLLAPPVH